MGFGQIMQAVEPIIARMFFENVMTILAPPSLESRDGSGVADGEWETFAEVEASIVEMSAQEQLVARERIGVVSHTITFAYVAGVTTAHVAQFGSRFFDIVGVVDVNGKGVYTQLWAAERT